jgi:effector-binding domain-containing protein
MQIAPFEIIETGAQNVLVIEKSVAEGDVAGFFGDSISRLEKYLHDKGLTPADTPYMRFVPESVTVTVGIAVVGPIAGNGIDITGSTIPAGRKVVSYFQGNDDLMGGFYADMEAFMAENGLERIVASYEYPINGLEYGLQKLLTKVVCEVK